MSDLNFVTVRLGRLRPELLATDYSGDELGAVPPEDVERVYFWHSLGLATTGISDEARKLHDALGLDPQQLWEGLTLLRPESRLLSFRLEVDPSCL